MSFPINDWQFWVVSAAAAIVVVIAVRKLWPGKKKRGTSVSLTINRSPVKKPR